MEKPKIEYPRSWAFKIIALENASVKLVVQRCLGERAFQLEASNASRTGKYCSFSLLTTVESEAERDQIFYALRDSDGVKMVL